MQIFDDYAHLLFLFVYNLVIVIQIIIRSLCSLCLMFTLLNNVIILLPKRNAGCLFNQIVCQHREDSLPNQFHVLIIL